MARNVWCFVPNLIGYARFVLLLVSIFYVLDVSSTPFFLALYAASYLLDAADGPAARSLQQTSKFGAVLDMVTDRVSTAVLLAALAHEAALKAWAPAWLGLLVLDIAAHWVQMYAGGLLGAASHKALPNEPALLTWYYRRTNLFIVCLLSETHLVTAFTLSRGFAGVKVGDIPFFGHPLPELPLPAQLAELSPLLTPDNLKLIAGWLYALSFPVFVLKQVISVIHLVRAAQRVVELDQAEDAAGEGGKGFMGTKKKAGTPSRSASRKAA